MNVLKLAAILMLVSALFPPNATGMWATSANNCHSETLINNSEITTYAMYESGNVQAKRYALYIFNVALILLIMSMKVKNHETTENHGKGHT